MDRNFVRAWRLSRHKCLELQLSAFAKPWDYLELSIALRHWRHDHAGASFSIQICNLYLELSFHDSRHWNREKNCWYTYPEDERWPEGAEPSNLEAEIECAKERGNPENWDLTRLEEKLRELKAASSTKSSEMNEDEI